MTITLEYNGLDYVVGDLIQAFNDGEVNFFAHQANCHKCMGSGIAAQVVTRILELYEADVSDTRTPEQRRGSYSFWIPHQQKAAFNLYGQFFPGRNTNVELLRKSLNAMSVRVRLMMTGDEVFGLPLIGCGVGGGDWDVVSNIIKETLAGLNVVIFVRSMDDYNRIVKKDTEYARSCAF